MDLLAKTELTKKWINHFTPEFREFLIENLGTDSQVFAYGSFRTTNGRSCLAEHAGQFHPRIGEIEYAGVDFLRLIGLTTTKSRMVKEWDRDRSPEEHRKFELELRSIIIDPRRVSRSIASAKKKLRGRERLRKWAERESARCARTKPQSVDPMPQTATCRAASQSSLVKWVAYEDFGSLRAAMDRRRSETVVFLEANNVEQNVGEEKTADQRPHSFHTDDSPKAKSRYRSFPKRYVLHESGAVVRRKHAQFSLPSV